MQSKEYLRKDVRHYRQGLTDKTVFSKSNIIENRFFDLALVNNCESFLLYSDFDNEVKTNGIITRLKELNKTVYLPVVCGEILYIYPCAGNFQKNKYGILEPLRKGDGVNPREVDVFVVPGICFDVCGGRIGFGKGYYDKLLSQASKRAIKVGLAYEFQVLESVYSEPHDIRMDYILTEDQTISVLR